MQTIPVTTGVKANVVLTTWAMHGSGQVFARPGYTLDAAIREKVSFALSEAEYAEFKDQLPEAGEMVLKGEWLIPTLLQADYDLELEGVSASERPDEKEWQIHFEWLRWALDYSGFKIKGLGLKGSMMPWIEPGTESTDPWALFPGVDLLVNLEAAKGQAITLAMFAEYRGGLDVGPDGLSAELQAEYDAWWQAHVVTHTVRHQVSSRMAEYYLAAGHTVVKSGHQLYVEQEAEFLTGSLVFEVEAPLVPHRVTSSGLSLMQAMLVAQDDL